eukprot:8995713-Pyramimonas_sp.AAC.1
MGGATPLVFRSLRERHLAADEVLVGSSILVHPSAILDHKAASWEKLWAPHPVRREEVCELFEDLREQVQYEELDRITVADIRCALQRMRPQTGKGVDQFTVLDLA